MAQLDKLGLSCYTTWWSLKSFIFCLPQQWQKPAIMVFWGANHQKCVKFNFFFGSYLTLLLSWNKKKSPLILEKCCHTPYPYINNTLHVHLHRHMHMKWFFFLTQIIFLNKNVVFQFLQFSHPLWPILLKKFYTPPL